MVPEIARETQANIANAQQQILSLTQSMNSSVNSLQSSFVGASATEFYGLYDQWRVQMNTLVEQLADLTIRLQNEIVEWETAAGKL
jgi:WXG100 family type VII secretion target